MRIILESVVGSTLHGTAVEDGLEDLDLMAIALGEPREVFGFDPVETVTERTKPVGVRSEAGDVDRVIYAIGKFLRLAMQGNPSVLLPLFAPPEHLRVLTGEGMQLRELTPAIVSRRAAGPFLGYMKQQHERLLGTRGQKRCTRPELVERFGFDTKYAGHILRLGYQGCELLTTGSITLPMPPSQRELVLQVRRGEVPFEAVDRIAAHLRKQLELAIAGSTLREEPDRARIEGWMLETLQRYWRMRELGAYMY